MKRIWGMRYWCGAVVAIFLGMVPALAAGAGRTKIAAANVFSYQAPPGWTEIKVTESAASAVPYPVTADRPDHPRAMITVNVDVAPLPLPEWCTKVLARNRADFAAYHAQLGELERFSTTTGFSGFRATLELTSANKDLHYVLYFFAGNDESKITATCFCATANADKYGPIFDEAMKSFVPY